MMKLLKQFQYKFYDIILARRSNNGTEFVLKILDIFLGKEGINLLLLAILLP
jgi:hypothetical protein